ncbi:TPA: tail fiber domain-containing protein [Pseudomonas putida]|nr:tail fiber domain-containing protein [Pseudomonas putida]
MTINRRQLIKISALGIASSAVSAAHSSSEMTMRYNTGNAVEPNGSSDPRDLFDNSANFDLAANGNASTWIDRKGRPRKSIAGMEIDFSQSQDLRDEQFQQFLLSSGYQVVGDYAAGILLTARNQLIRKDGEYYRIAAAVEVPYTTNGVWFSESGNFISVGDAALRQELATPAGGGLVWIQQDWPGSIPRTVLSSYRDEVSIRQFDGAVGNGVADDTAAFVLAANTGKTVKVTDGDWQVTVTNQFQAEAIRSLMSRLRVSGSLVVNYAEGTFEHTAPLLYRVDGGQNVKIRGATPIPVSITGQVGVTGSAGAYNVTLSLSSIEGVAVGHFLHTDTTFGTGHHYSHRGTWPIISVDALNSRVVVRNTHRKSTFPVNAITSSESGVVRTNLHFKNCDALVVPESTLGEISALVASGNSDEYWSSANVSGTEKGTHGAVIGSQTIARNGKPDNVNPIGVSGGHVSAGRYFGVYGFDQQGIVCEGGGTFWGDFVASCNNKRRGFYISTGAAGRFKHISTAGCYLDGLIVDLGGSAYASSSSYSGGHGGSAISATQSGMISFDDGIMANCVGAGANIVENGVAQFVRSLITDNANGVIALYGSTVYCDNSQILNSAGYGIDANFNSSVRAPSCTISGSGQFGLRATENSFINHTNANLAGNVAGALTYRAGGLLLDGSSYREGGAFNAEYRSIALASGAGVRFITTSGGDDFQVGHDTTGSGSYTPKFHMRSSTTGFYSESDNDTPIGRATNRWSTGYFGSAPIVSSDRWMKDEIAPIPDDILDAWEDVEYSRYKFKADIARKAGTDEEARWHIGFIAQQIEEAFAAHGLDAFEYGLLCHDTWEAKPAELDEEGNVISAGREAGSCYSVRYEEALAMESALLRRSQVRLEERLSVLENK